MVNVKLVETEQKNICGNACVAAKLSIHPFIVNGLKHTQPTKVILVRCDSCIAVEEQTREQERANTYAMVMTQDTTNKNNSQRQTILQQ